jgi:hypothetical protein
MSRSNVAFLALLVPGFVGCVSGTQGYTNQKLKENPPSSSSLLVMAPDVQLFELTAGGGLEPKADWTEMAEKHVTVGVIEELRAKKLHLVPYEPPPEGSPQEHDNLQLVKLHQAVLQAILTHHYNPNLKAHLPGKHGRFDWTLGPGVGRLRGDKKADYVLFVWMRDSYASGGRAALVAISSIFSPLTGTRASGGEQAGFASLVDLETGDVVWCNALYRESGDLRTEEKARKAVQMLIGDLPL